LTFLYHRKPFEQWGDAEGEVRRRMEESVQAVRGNRRKIRDSKSLKL